MLLVKKPLNQSFQSRVASRQAHFWFLTIPIPPVVNNHALKISNTNKSQPKTRQGVWWSKQGGIRTSTKDGTTSVTSFLLFCLVDKSICNSKRLPRVEPSKNLVIERGCVPGAHNSISSLRFA